LIGATLVVTITSLIGATLVVTLTSLVGATLIPSVFFTLLEGIAN
jgi:hypothetical protein